MRIHSDVLTWDNVFHAANVARAAIVTDGPIERGSRKRARAFEVKLEGESRRRPNGGASGAGSGYAATWDQWGVFLAELFQLDPAMVTPYYADADDYARKTGDRFGALETVMTADGYRDVFQAYGWPEDAHGDHTFRFTGTPREHRCTKCSAVQRF